MDRWADHAYPILVRIADQDVDYQDLLQQCMGQEAGYKHILSRLSEEERLTVDDYVASCEELLFRFAQLAYRLGLVDGSMA